MPFALLIVGLDIFCVVHCIRHRRNMSWLFLILMVPLIGSAIYIFSEVLPASQARRQRALANPLRYRPPKDPKTLSMSNVYLREQEGQHFATQQVDVEADKLFKLAQTALASHEYEEAIQLLSRIRAQHDYRPSVVRLLLAQAYASADKPQKAEPLFKKLAQQPEPLYSLEYARFLRQQQRPQEAQSLLESLHEACELRDEGRWLMEIETELRHLSSEHSRDAET